jgi:hypothetical protein
MGGAISFSILSLFAELILVCVAIVRRIRQGKGYTPGPPDLGLCVAAFGASLCAFLFPASYVMMSAGWGENEIFSAWIAGIAVLLFVAQLVTTLARPS